MDSDAKTHLEANLGLLYGKEAGRVVEQIESLVASWDQRIRARASSWTERDTFLITYGDSLRAEGETGFASLSRFLRERVGDRLSLIHILPFFPSTGDDGFSVANFREIADGLGDWEAIGSLAQDYRMVFDAVVNHVSKTSPYVRGHLSGDPEFANFGIESNPAFDISQVTRPRTSPLFHTYEGKDGPVELWTTFSEDQIDLNFANPAVLIEILDVLLFYAAKGASMIRLDAIPYMWKESGTACVHRPQTHAFIRIARLVLDLAAPHVIILSETNVPHDENLTYFGNRGDEAQIIYNFTLAPLILYGLKTGDAEPLTRWAATLDPPDGRCTFLNITSTHDGIGMRPTEGILDEGQQRVLADLAVDHGGAVSYRSNPDGSESPYELNITFFDAVNNPNDPTLDEDTQFRRFLVSQAIPMSLVGIPALYINCLLGSRNDVAGWNDSGIRRRINREKLALSEIEADLDSPQTLRARVFDGLLRLLEIRQSNSAFHPAANNTVLELGRNVFAVLRENETTGNRVLALHNLSAEELTCTIPVSFAISAAKNLLGAGAIAAIAEGQAIALPAFGIRWLAL